MSRILTVYVPVVVFILTVGLLTAHEDLIGSLSQQMSGMNTFSYAIYVVILVIAVVAMPITVMPLIPVAASLLGPLATALLSVVGWTIGAAIAFLLARHIGRPILERFISFKKIDALTKKIPQETKFLSIVLLRLTLPVDIVSYALGLSKTIGFGEYIAATLVGVVWFSFAFAYMGDALLNQDIVLLIEIGAASVLVFAIGSILLTRSRKK